MNYYSNDNIISSYNVLNDFCHYMSLYDPNGNLVAKSCYQYDKKQFIRFTPPTKGYYNINIQRIDLHGGITKCAAVYTTG